ncbi:hypothetical protein BEN49_17185 [Hymenobacter coccineus]|uniref:Uncharacterized protein n=1 Tax=Hymenobacter coccineus TaxID=1908235 RepID=A0A1G1TMK1_9BACT|nr:hypothetical protein BEN49_17185 [Hymenobacter coccineus]
MRAAAGAPAAARGGAGRFGSDGGCSLRYGLSCGFGARLGGLLVQNLVYQILLAKPLEIANVELLGKFFEVGQQTVLQLVEGVHRKIRGREYRGGAGRRAWGRQRRTDGNGAYKPPAEEPRQRGTTTLIGWSNTNGGNPALLMKRQGWERTSGTLWGRRPGHGGRLLPQC